ncbi:hypothetical protein QP835_11345 [Pseudomonas oryzihabitans]|uniref:hypothetical protein n=1 Tax=Pseudomonas oryzihabitans TaxID=47885 RepID=UPI0025569DD0|nr:hypothetical protein [Pseudomonas oryzihabitans]MDK8264871.1 hypothetical protein [Pseudomonas oryzihabitans]
MSSYLFDPRIVPTAPGSHGIDPFAPPATFVGSPEEYRALIRDRYRDHYGRYRILLHVKAAEEGATLTFLGPYAAEAQLIINTLFGQTEHPERVSAR